MTPAISDLIHDTSNPTKRIKGLVAMLRDDKLSHEEKSQILDFIEQSAKDVDIAVDNYYISQYPETAKKPEPKKY